MNFFITISGKTVFRLGTPRDDRPGAPQVVLLSDLSHHRRHLRHLVSLRIDRQNCHGNQIRTVAMAILDQIGRGGHWIHWRIGFHVHTMQGLCAFVQEVEGF